MARRKETRTHADVDMKEWTKQVMDSGELIDQVAAAEILGIQPSAVTGAMRKFGYHARKGILTKMKFNLWHPEDIENVRQKRERMKAQRELIKEQTRIEKSVLIDKKKERPKRRINPGQLEAIERGVLIARDNLINAGVSPEMVDMLFDMSDERAGKKGDERKEEID